MIRGAVLFVGLNLAGLHLIVPCAAGAFVVADPTTADPPQTEAPPAAPATERLRGRVVWLAEAMQRLHGVSTDPDAAQSQAALETVDGKLYPLVKDARGRGFWIDERMREVEMELVVRRFAGAPSIQVIRLYTIKGDRKYEFDYWCDICAIPMYELKACECCQGPTRIRERPVQ